jgi:hypothetical protein
MGEKLMTAIYEPSSTMQGGCGCGCGADRECARLCGCGTCAWTGGQAWAGLERTRFYPRQLVTPDDLTQDQIYFRDKLRRHNRLLHGWGLICGLVVERCAGSDPDGKDPCKVKISSGNALDPYGNEIVVWKSEVIDLCKENMTGALACLPQDDPWCRPIGTSRTGTFYLAVRLCERAVKPVHAPTGCSCKDASCENSRYRDEYEFLLLPDLPDHYGSPCRPQLDPCAGIDQCPGCPTSGWVVLATVTLRGSAIEEITQQNRRHLVSMAGSCLDCSAAPNDFVKYPKMGVKKRLIGITTTTPDALVRLHAIINTKLTEVEIPVKNADLQGKTALEVANAWANVPLFDTDDPSSPLLDASWLLAHSPMKGTWIVESADDLSARLGNPVIDTTTYPQRRQALQDLLDQAGRKHLHDDLLDNVDRLDEIELDMLAGVSKKAAANLEPIGIHSVADLKTIDLQNKLIPTAVRPRLITVRDAITSHSGSADSGDRT